MSSAILLVSMPFHKPCVFRGAAHNATHKTIAVNTGTGSDFIIISSSLPSVPAPFGFVFAPLVMPAGLEVISFAGPVQGSFH